jgi:ABC-type molybdenum transport system ATPase subunit/photorepair protein PhrA
MCALSLFGAASPGTGKQMATPVTSFSAQATSPSQIGQSPIQIHQHVSVQIEHKRIIENLSFELAPGEN